MKKNKAKASVNENLETFSKSEKNKGKKSKVRKSRYFSFMTYASEKELCTTMSKHQTSIRAFAYIKHDKDEAEPHFHLLVRTYSSWTENQILKWFDWVKLKSNQNTFVEILDDTISMYEYLTHSDYASVIEKKHVYDRTEIKDFGLFDIVDKRNSYDETYDILQRVMAGMPEIDLVRNYGKNYLYHRNVFQEAADVVYHQSSGFNRAEFKNDTYRNVRMIDIDTGCVDIYDLLNN